MRVRLADMGVDSLEDIVGTECYEEALRYVRQHAVVQQVWVAAQNALCGVVRVGPGEFHTPAVYFSGDRVSSAQCSCTARYGCAHAAALLMAADDEEPSTYQEPAADWDNSAADWGSAAGQAPPARQNPAARQAPAARQNPDPADWLDPVAGLGSGAERDGEPGRGRQPTSRGRTPSWQRSLDSLFDESDGPGQASAIEIPLAIELTLTYGRLMARLLQPGRNGTWIYGSLSWARLDSYDYHGEYRADHVRLLRELYALHRSRTNLTYYYEASNGERQIDLSEFDSPRLWPLLDEAGPAGLRLLHAGQREPVGRYETAEFCLDVTEADGLSIRPVIRIGDATAGVTRPAVGFIGSPAHGVIYASSTEPFRLARLTRPVAAGLSDLMLSGEPLVVPAAETDRFRTGYYPKLRRAVTVISADGTFTAPEVSAPTLVLQAAYGAGHEVEVGWEWLYQVAGVERRLPLEPGPGGDYRDREAERAILNGLPPALGPTAARHSAHFRGLDTMRFTTELLPGLRDQPGVAVEVTGAPADYREAPAVIAVSTAERAGDRDWFDLSVTITADGQSVPFTDVFMALSRDDTHLLLLDGTYFSLEKPELQALKKLIEEARALRDPDGPLTISRFQAGLWEELAALGVVGRQAKAWQQQVRALLTALTPEPIDPPATVNALLRPYQLDGFRWLAFLWQHRLGGILADDMGLGKTLQTLTLISHARQADPDGPPFIIVAPTSVVPNWAAEAAKFTPDLTVATVTSRGPRLSELRKTADAIVTSYALLRLDVEDYADVEWSGLILDEAQYTKNHQSQIYQCARKLPAQIKVAITGTPLENNLMELWSLLSIAAPGLFPNPDRFKEYYCTAIEKKGDRELLAQLKRRVRPLMLRRTKKQVASDLPAKQEQVLEVELHPKHRKLYQMHLQRERQKVLGLIDDMNANRFTILRSLTLLRQLSLHPGLVDTAHGDLPCAKIDTLIDQVRDVAAGGHRALVFSQFTGFLAYVKYRLAAEGIEYCYLDGSTRDRASVLNAFKTGSAPVFLISLKAGGFGLNLTEADYCFMLDPWWNPATEAQAIDRTHRIGQTRNVMVYRLIAKDTIEEKVMALKVRKAELFASVLDEGAAFGGGITADDIKGLFS
jgi:superfamily II DNA or RNA helicase